MTEVENGIAWRWPAAEASSAAKTRSQRPELARIGAHLRAFYGDVVDEPLPDRLMRLLHRLEQEQV